MFTREGSVAVWSAATDSKDEILRRGPRGRRAACIRRRKVMVEAMHQWRCGAKRQEQKTKRRLLSRHLIPRPVRKGVP
jgi:hypothetical protein